MHYFGDDNDQHKFTLEIKSPRVHYLNWGSENDKKLVPPYPKRFSRFSNLKVIKEKMEDCEHIVSDAVLQMVYFYFLKLYSFQTNLINMTILK